MAKSDAPVFRFRLGPPPAPQKTDRLNDPDLKGSAINIWINSNQFLYSAGYRLAAKNLTAQLLKDTSDKAVLFYPIFFLYRHHIELLLKRMIRNATRLLNQNLTEEQRHRLGRHKIDDLWMDLSPMLAGLSSSSGCDEAVLDGISSYIKQIAELDPDGQRARYSHTTRGDQSMSADNPMDFENFTRFMETLADCLEYIDTGLDGSVSCT